MHENVIEVFGNGFSYISGGPEILLLPSKSKVEIDWRYEYKVFHAPEGQVGGVMPSEMQIWISRLEPGASYRLEYHGFSAEFTAGNDIRYLFPAKEEKSASRFRSFLKRIGLYGK